MHIGVVPLLDGDSGGVYQYCLSVLAALRSPGSLRAGDRVTVFVHDVASPRVAQVCDPAWTIRPLNPATLRGLLSATCRAVPGLGALIDLLRSAKTDGAKGALRDPNRPRRNPRLGQWFGKAGVDVMLFPVPISIAFECGLPFIFTVHDLQHRLQPHFPEVGEPKEWNDREYLFRNGVLKALAVVVDSETGHEDVLSCYGPLGVTADTVKVLPFLPANYLPISDAGGEVSSLAKWLRLPAKYFFYPAQFWPHKNHERLIEALAVLRERHSLDTPLVLCGSHNNWIREATFAKVMARATALGVADLVHYLGFVDDADMLPLYAGARALLMPTFFGPTNIPILEAWATDCPVMTSNIRGVREQAGDAALLVDPESTEQIADGMRQLWTDDSSCVQLRKNGRNRLGLWKPEDFAKRLGSILDFARSRGGFS